MLVISRKRDESIIIGNGIEIIVVDVRIDKVRLGISVPAEMHVHRKEVWEAIQREDFPEPSQRPPVLSMTSVPASPSVIPIRTPSTAKLDPLHPLESLKTHLLNTLGADKYEEIRPLLDQLTETKSIVVK